MRNPIKFLLLCLCLGQSSHYTAQIQFLLSANIFASQPKDHVANISRAMIIVDARLFTQIEACLLLLAVGLGSFFVSFVLPRPSQLSEHSDRGKRQRRGRAHRIIIAPVRCYGLIFCRLPSVIAPWICTWGLATRV